MYLLHDVNMFIEPSGWGNVQTSHKISHRKHYTCYTSYACMYTLCTFMMFCWAACLTKYSMLQYPLPIKGSTYFVSLSTAYFL